MGCLNLLFTEFDKLADAVDVEKIKTVGDNHMAVAGVPSPRSGHAQTATKLALDMVVAATRLRRRLSAPFPIRVGVRSGPVMAGIIGARKFAYDVWGDTVDIASHLEGASQPNRVLISATTASQLSGEFKLDGSHKIGTKEQARYRGVLRRLFLRGRDDLVHGP